MVDATTKVAPERTTRNYLQAINYWLDCHSDSGPMNWYTDDHVSFSSDGASLIFRRLNEAACPMHIGWKESSAKVALGYIDACLRSPAIECDASRLVGRLRVPGRFLNRCSHCSGSCVCSCMDCYEVHEDQHTACVECRGIGFVMETRLEEKRIRIGNNNYDPHRIAAFLVAADVAKCYVSFADVGWKQECAVIVAGDAAMLLAPIEADRTVKSLFSK